MKFTLREVILLAVIVALAAGWTVDSQKSHAVVRSHQLTRDRLVAQLKETQEELGSVQAILNRKE